MRNKIEENVHRIRFSNGERLIFIRDEDDAEKWLRAHDPYYADKRKNKRVGESYPYDTRTQGHRRMRIEIPFSNLLPVQREALYGKIGLFVDDCGNWED